MFPVADVGVFAATCAAAIIILRARRGRHKPHAVNAQVDGFVHSHLASRGIRVLKSGTLSGSTAMAGIIDKHYGTLAERAMTVSPENLPSIPEKARSSFQETWNVSWEDAIANGQIKNL